MTHTEAAWEGGCWAHTFNNNFSSSVPCWLTLGLINGVLTVSVMLTSWVEGKNWARWRKRDEGETEKRSQEKKLCLERSICPVTLQQEARGEEECFTCGDLSITTQAHFRTWECFNKASRAVSEPAKTRVNKEEVNEKRLRWRMGRLVEV